MFADRVSTPERVAASRRAQRALLVDQVAEQQRRRGQQPRPSSADVSPAAAARLRRRARVTIDIDAERSDWDRRNGGRALGEFSPAHEVPARAPPEASVLRGPASAPPSPAPSRVVTHSRPWPGPVSIKLPPSQAPLPLPIRVNWRRPDPLSAGVAPPFPAPLLSPVLGPGFGHGLTAALPTERNVPRSRADTSEELRAAGAVSALKDELQKHRRSCANERAGLQSLSEQLRAEASRLLLEQQVPPRFSGPSPRPLVTLASVAAPPPTSSIAARLREQERLITARSPQAAIPLSFVPSSLGGPSRALAQRARPTASRPGASDLLEFTVHIKAESGHRLPSVPVLDAFSQRDGTPLVGTLLEASTLVYPSPQGHGDDHLRGGASQPGAKQPERVTSRSVSGAPRVPSLRLNALAAPQTASSSSAPAISEDFTVAAAAAPSPRQALRGEGDSFIQEADDPRKASAGQLSAAFDSLAFSRTSGGTSTNRVAGGIASAASASPPLPGANGGSISPGRLTNSKGYNAVRFAEQQGLQHKHEMTRLPGGQPQEPSLNAVAAPGTLSRYTRAAGTSPPNGPGEEPSFNAVVATANAAAQSRSGMGNSPRTQEFLLSALAPSARGAPAISVEQPAVLQSSSHSPKGTALPQVPGEASSSSVGDVHE